MRLAYDPFCFVYDCSTAPNPNTPRPPADRSIFGASPGLARASLTYPCVGLTPARDSPPFLKRQTGIEGG